MGPLAVRTTQTAAEEGRLKVSTSPMKEKKKAKLKKMVKAKC